MHDCGGVDGLGLELAFLADIQAGVDVIQLQIDAAMNTAMTAVAAGFAGRSTGLAAPGDSLGASLEDADGSVSEAPSRRLAADA
jgi:hypothetical protein